MSRPIAALQSIRHASHIRVWWQNITRACHIYTYLLCGCVAVWMHVWMCGCMCGCVAVWMHVWMCGCMCGCVDACVDVWMCGCMCGSQRRRQFSHLFILWGLGLELRSSDLAAITFTCWAMPSAPWLFIFNKVSFISGIWEKFGKQTNVCACVYKCLYT
jgi:hypothetical protein